MKFPSYPKYKESGVEWLGPVPEHWNVKKMKFIGRSIIGLTYRPEEVVNQEDGVLVLRSSNILDGKIVLGDTIYVNADIKDELIAQPGDILICSRNGSRALIGKNALIDDISAGSSFGAFMTIFRSKYSSFVYYALNSSLFNFQSGAYMTSTINQLTISTLNNFKIPLPTLPEQHAIAAFLDAQTAKLDTLIATKRALIAKLKEKRAALITRTVTRGLPPEAAKAAGLDPHPKMKDSGVEWLGEVPEHWKISRFSRVVYIAEGQVNPEIEPYSEMLLIAPNHVESGTGQLMFKQTASEQGAESGKYICKVGDIVYSKIRPALAKLVISPEDCLCSADMYPLRGRADIYNCYLYWTMLSVFFTAWSVLESDRVAMPKINRETLGSCLLCVPPLSEQRAIAAFLDTQTTKIDSLVTKIEFAIAKLQEYRAALITAAVTGKINVSGVNI